jgi:hypothetical protein
MRAAPHKADPRNTNPRGDPANLTRSSRMRGFYGAFMQVFLGFCGRSARGSPGFAGLSCKPDHCCTCDRLVFYGNFPGLFREFSQFFVEDSPRPFRDLTGSWQPGLGLIRDHMDSWLQDEGVFQGFCGAPAEDLPSSSSQAAGVYPTPESGIFHRRSGIWGIASGFCGDLVRIFLDFYRSSPGDSPGICRGLTRP